MKWIPKLALAAAVAGLAFTAMPTDLQARGAKKAAYCAPGSLRVTKSTCGSWGLPLPALLVGRQVVHLAGLLPESLVSAALNGACRGAVPRN